MINVFEQIKDRINLVEYVSRYVKLRPIGGSYFGVCPFHVEKTGSFSVDGKKGVFHCFGCQAGGDIFEFYMKYNNVDKKEALRALSALAGVSFSTGLSTRKKQTLDILADYFVQHLEQSDVVKKILSDRCVDKKSIEKFKLGLAPDSSSIQRFLKENQLNLENYGFNDYSWKMFEHRIIFPIYDVNADICSFGGRVYKTNDMRAKYVNGPAPTSRILTSS